MDLDFQWKRLDDLSTREMYTIIQAREAVLAELQTLHDNLPKDSPPELAAILEVHLMLVQDTMLADGVSGVATTYYHCNGNFAFTGVEAGFYVVQFLDCWGKNRCFVALVHFIVHLSSTHVRVCVIWI